MVEFIHGIVALLAGVVLVLTATVAWLYVQQSRMMHAVNALAVAVTAPPPSFMMHSEPEPEPQAEAEPERDQDQEAPVEASAEYVELPAEVHVDDDRVSVHEVNDQPEASGDAIESVQGKTVAQLREMLTAKGIPFNKSDKKPVLISLVQISA